MVRTSQASVAGKHGVSGRQRANHRHRPSRGRKSRSALIREVGKLLRRLGDLYALECSWLSSHPGVMATAQDKFQRTFWPEALALQSILKEAAGHALEDLHEFSAAGVLKKVLAGQTLVAIAVEFGIRRETLSRRDWSVARQAVCVHVVRLLEDGAGHASGPLGKTDVGASLDPDR